MVRCWCAGACVLCVAWGSDGQDQDREPAVRRHCPGSGFEKPGVSDGGRRERETGKGRKGETGKRERSRGGGRKQKADRATLDGKDLGGSFASGDLPFCLPGTGNWNWEVTGFLFFVFIVYHPAHRTRRTRTSLHFAPAGAVAVWRCGGGSGNGGGGGGLPSQSVASSELNAPPRAGNSVVLG